MLPVAEPRIGNLELEYVTRAVKSGWVSSIGEFITDFENGFAAYCDVKHGIAVCNGTAALQLALAALGIGPDDEVIIPTLTFVATANAVHYLGAKPVFTDVQADCWQMDPKQIEPLITARTKAIIAVHLYGHPADMDAITAIAAKHDIPVIEDAAEAHGAKYRGRTVGSIGKIACFSFYGNKIITTGEGGMCLTSDSLLAEKMSLLRDHAMSKERRYWHEQVGYNFRMTNLQAALGCAQLQQIDDFITRKIEIAGWYREGLEELAEDGKLTLHPQMDWAGCVYWLYSVLIADGFGRDVSALTAALRESGIDSRPFFYPNHLLPPYAGGPALPVAKDIARRGISLPSGVDLTRQQVNDICDTLRKLASS